MRNRLFGVLLFSTYLHLLFAQCPPLEPIVGPTLVKTCSNIIDYYYIPNAADANLVWTLSPLGVGSFQGPSTGESVGLQWSSAPATVQLCATPTNPCYDPTPICIDITVEPVYIDGRPHMTVCNGDQVNVQFTGNGWTYGWTNTNPAIGLPASGTGHLDFIATNSSNMPIAGWIVAWPLQGDCQGSQGACTFFITVLPSPVVDQPPDLSVCGGETVLVNFTGTADATFEWTNDNPAIGLPAAGMGNISFNTAFVNQTQVANITVIPRIFGCPGEPVTFTITVNASTADEPPDVTVCPGAPVFVGLSGNAASFNWTNNNPDIGLGSSGSGDISFTAANVPTQQVATITILPQPCPLNTPSFTVTVLPNPYVNPPPDVTVCVGEPANIALTGSPATLFNWGNSNPNIGLTTTGSGPLINFTAAPVNDTISGLITVTPTGSTCTGEPQYFTVTVLPCCITDAGALDSADQTVCLPAGIALSHDSSQQLAPGDSLRFILFSDSLDPLGSIVQYSDSLFFSYLPGITLPDSLYYTAVIAGPLLPNDSIDATAPCFSLVRGPVLRWVDKPTIEVQQPPEAVCKDGCVDVQFDFTGFPPFHFSWRIMQNGQTLLDRTETADALQLTITVCTADFAAAPAGGPVQFQVYFLEDAFCGCE